MSKIELRPKPVIPERFKSPNPEVAVFIVNLMSYVDHSGRTVQHGEDNLKHFNYRPANEKPFFFHSFYFEHPEQLEGGVYLLGGLDQQNGSREINGQNYDLYTSYDLIYSQRGGFKVAKIQSAIPVVFSGENAITLGKTNLTDKGIQRLTKKIHSSTKS